MRYRFDKPTTLDLVRSVWCLGSEGSTITFQFPPKDGQKNVLFMVPASVLTFFVKNLGFGKGGGFCCSAGDDDSCAGYTGGKSSGSSVGLLIGGLVVVGFSFLSISNLSDMLLPLSSLFSSSIFVGVSLGKGGFAISATKGPTLGGGEGGVGDRECFLR
jgi:hypothetical protein